MGGKATKGIPIPGEYSKEMYENISNEIIKLFQLSSNDVIPLGSTGKRPNGQYCGDIDMAIDGTPIGNNFKLEQNKIQNFVADTLREKYENVNNNRGLCVVSFSYPIPNTNDNGQVDIMLSYNIPMTNFYYYSPDFTKNESKYKGIYRNQLLFSILSQMNTKDPDTYFKDGSVKSFTKYSLTAQLGLFKQTKTYEGKNGKLKNPKIIKDKNQYITSDPVKIVEYIFGNGCNTKNIDTFEKLYHIICSDECIHSVKLKRILKNFKNSIIRLRLPIPIELKTKCQESII